MNNIEREQRKELFRLLERAKQHRRSRVKDVPVPAVIRSARAEVLKFEKMAGRVESKQQDRIEAEAARVRHEIIFGGVRKALKLVRAFRAGK